MSEATVEEVNALVESRIAKLKKELPQVLDYAKMKKLQSCVESIKDCVGYASDEQVDKVASESAKMLSNTKNLIESQAKTISEKSEKLNESTKKIASLCEQVKQMKEKLEVRDK